MTTNLVKLSQSNGNNSEQAEFLQLAALLEITHHIVSLDTEPLLGLVLDQLKSLVKYTCAAIVALAGEELVVIAFRGPDHQKEIKNWQIPLKNSPFEYIITHQREPVIISDIWADTPEAQTFRNVAGEQLESALKSIHSWIGIPLVVKKTLRGMLILLHEKPNFYTVEQGNQVLVFAHQVAIAIENDQLYQQVQHLATLEERERLAREMHDQLAQALGYINIKTSIINDLLENEQIGEAQEHLRELKQIARDTYTDVREEIFNLRTKISAGEKFLPILREYVADYQEQHHTEINLIITDGELAELSSAAGTQLIRIIQEALHNVRKHAQANQVIIRLEPDGNQVCLYIEDNGTGFDPKQTRRGKRSSFGLQIMRERAESIGGRLEIHSKPGDGTQLRVSVPYG